MSNAAADEPNTQVQMTYMEALVQAQIEEFERDETVIMMGEDLAVYGDGKVAERFPSPRVLYTPISETSFTGAGIGAAICGLRPIIALNIASFMYLASDPIINQAAKLRFMTGGHVKIPIVFRCSMYYRRGLAAQHSDRPYPMFLNVPGLKIICPSTPVDVKGLFKAAVRDDDPVMIFEDASCWPLKGAVPTDRDFLIPIGTADVKRLGSDVTVVALAGMVKPALEAADQLAAEGVSVEVVDPRTLKPLDMETIAGSLRKTGRLVLVEMAHRVANLSAEIAAEISEHAFESLKRPVQRLCVPDVHIPFSPVLEQSLYPTRETIAAAVRKIL